MSGTRSQEKDSEARVVLFMQALSQELQGILQELSSWGSPWSGPRTNHPRGSSPKGSITSQACHCADHAFHDNGLLETQHVFRTLHSCIHMYFFSFRAVERLHKTNSAVSFHCLIHTHSASILVGIGEDRKTQRRKILGCPIFLFYAVTFGIVVGYHRNVTGIKNYMISFLRC